MIEIKEVKGIKEINRFIDFPINLYKDNEYFVPPLRTSEKELFKKKNPYISSCDTIYYNAYLDGKIVGRISGIIQKDANEKWNQKRVRFTRFDSIDNQEVANALFDAVINWAKNKGMNEIVGPLGFNDLEREGLLIEGFDKLSTFEEQYNYDYYQKLIENYGFIKDTDWIESEIRLPDKDVDRLCGLSEFILKRYNLTIVREKTVPIFVRKHKDEFFQLLEDTYCDLYGTCPIRKEVQKSLMVGFKLLLRSDNIIGVANDKGEMIAFGLYFPSIAKAVQKNKGCLSPIGIIRILKAIKNPDVLDYGLIGVRKDYRNKGIPSVMIKSSIELLQTGKYDHFETNLNLEDNTQIINLFNRFNRTQHKRRRSFIKEIK